MFSCVLLQCGGKREDSTALLAEKATVDIQVVSTVGRGTATLNYVVGENRDLVVCIPRSITSKNGCSEEVKVTGCHFDVTDEGRTTLQLVKQDDHYSTQVKSLPTFATVRKGLANSISADDTIIHLGRFEPKSGITIHIKFLLRLIHKSLTCHVLDNNIMAKKVLYSLSYASQVNILGVSSTSSVFSQFEWKFKDNSQKAVSVQYSTESGLHEMDEMPSLSIELSKQVVKQSECCVCLKSSGSDHEPQPASRIQPALPDGIMVASCKLSPDQLSNATARNCSIKKGGGTRSGGSSLLPPPSEFVFLVDCSASMNPYNDSLGPTLTTCLKSLHEGCYFNLIQFGSSFRCLSSQSLEYTGANVRRAINYAYSLKPTLGGTELFLPLQWAFKHARKMEMPCQVFVITDVDQEVKDMAHIFNAIKKNRHYSRCHTFGLGSDICRSLVAGIAEAGRGKCVLLTEADRLQTKVMEVLHECLEPALMETKVHFRAPPGYSVVDSTPETLGVTFSHEEILSFAVLRKTSKLSSECHVANGFEGSANARAPAATVVGRVAGEEELEIPIETAMVPQLNSHQLQDFMDLLNWMASWSKIEELEVQKLKCSSRKSSKVEEEDEKGDSSRNSHEGEPSAKRQRLNGDRYATAQSSSNAVEVEEKLVNASLNNDIPCLLTYFKGISDSGRMIVQLLPHKHHPSLHSAARNGLITNRRPKNGIVSSRAKRAGALRKHGHNQNSDCCSSDLASSFPTSIVKSSLSALGNSLRSIASNFFLTPPVAQMDFDDAKTLEDEEEMERMKETQLSWKNYGKVKLRYPRSYYQSHKHPSPNSLVQKNSSMVVVEPSLANTSGHCPVGSNEMMCQAVVQSNGHMTLLQNTSTRPFTPSITKETLVSHSTPFTSSLQTCQSNRGGVSSSYSLHSSYTQSVSLPGYHSQARRMSVDNSDDEDDKISESESDCSVVLASLPKIRNQSSILKMQLFSGAWPFGRNFAYVTLVSISDIKLLPLIEEEREKWLPTEADGNQELYKGSTSKSSELEDESLAHFWCTALAVVCLQECFPQHEVEWKLIVAKGMEWIEQNLYKCGMELDQVYNMARDEILKGTTTVS